MLIPISWITELLDIREFSLNQVIEKLTLAGFEVEEIINLIIFQDEEIVLDISATANRSDSLSICGIVEEISALIDQPKLTFAYNKNNSIFYNHIEDSFKIESENLLNDCSLFSNIIVTNITEKSSPRWLQKKLIACGLTVENNLLDLQNYILLETGYPFEFYDLEKICCGDQTDQLTINLKNLEDQTKFTGTNNIEYTLNAETPVIVVNNKTISVAGIISNQDYQYTQQTKDLLIEGTIFGSKKIRQLSRKLGLRTNRSARYEKSLNPSNYTDAIYRLLSLLKMYDKDINIKFHSATRTVQPKQKTIELNYDRITEILGSINALNSEKPKVLNPNLISKYLERLNFQIQFDNTHLKWQVIIPQTRIEDITREIDVIEEIARLHGFNNFTSALPPIPQIGKQDSSYQIRKKVTSCFLSEGLNELILYSLTKEKFNNSIEIVNPLLQDCSCLQQTLLFNLLTVANDNIKQANLPLEGFEFGHVFYKSKKNTYKEKEFISGIFGGKQTKKNWSDKHALLSWFEAKGKLDNVFTKLNVNTKWNQKYFSSSDNIYEKIFHPHRTAEITTLDNEILGIFGQIHPLVAKNLSLPTMTYLFEFDCYFLNKQIESNSLILYKNYSLYPKIVKDISFIVNEKISYNDIAEIIQKNGSEFLSSITLMDKYKNKEMDSHSHSLCIQLTFQSDKTTLLTSEVGEIVTNITIILEKEFKATFRT